VEPAASSESAVGGGAGRRAGRVVSRPGLFDRLGGSARVSVVSGAAGSGKTVLLQSWAGEAGLAGRVAWVDAGRDVRDPQPFWLSVVSALRATGPGSELVRAVSAAPDLDGWALVERLLNDLAPLEERLWLVVDDAHELDADQALRQLELLLMRAPPGLRFVLATRHDLRLGLHRLRLKGELAEIRAGDLRFSLAEAAELFAAAGVEMPGPAVAVLHERTEGWAAGLRLAALAVVGHPDPEQFAAGFSGAERTVAEYLLAEVLERQGEQVRLLLLRTSILERVNGELADLLTGDEGAERVLQDLEVANAFVVSLDPARTWFRYHQMFAALLRLELRRAEPGAVTGLHATCAGWLAGQGFAVEAVRQAQAAEDWELAARMLAGHWPALHLDGQAATVHELLAGFPAVIRAADAELAVVAAADELAQGSLEAAERYLTLAERHSGSVPAGRGEYGRLLLGVVRLLLDRQRGNLPAVATDVRELQAMTEVADAARPGLGADLSALALISLGGTEFWADAYGDAARHLEQGVALARRIGRPYLEFTGLAQWSAVAIVESFTRAVELGTEAAELAERHGWTGDPAFGLVGASLGAVLTWQWRAEEAEHWLQTAERILGADQPGMAAAMRFVRGELELLRNRDSAAVAAFQAADLLAGRLASPHMLIPWIRALLLLAMVRLGQTGPAGQFLAALSDTDRERGEIRMAEAALRLAGDDPRAATAALASVLDGSAPVVMENGRALAYVLEAVARDAVGDADAADRALERALDLAEPDGLLLPFLLLPPKGLLERQARHRTAHAPLVAEIRGMLAGSGGDGGAAGGHGGGSPRAGESRPPVSRQGLGRIVAPRLPEPLLEPLSGSEIRVLRYLPTNLTAPEIARELSVSPNTVRTHVKSLYAKLGTHGRAGAVERARALGLLAPSAGAGRHQPAPHRG
jgi:LuxR family transcriptional regulator, maltose regulon positive regulatory protein